MPSEEQEKIIAIGLDVLLSFMRLSDFKEF
jgi:hypothetical protein